MTHTTCMYVLYGCAAVASYPGSPSWHAIHMHDLWTRTKMRSIARKEGEPGYEASAAEPIYWLVGKPEELYFIVYVHTCTWSSWTTSQWMRVCPDHVQLASGWELVLMYIVGQCMRVALVLMYNWVYTCSWPGVLTSSWPVSESLLRYTNE